MKNYYYYNITEKHGSFIYNACVYKDTSTDEYFTKYLNPNEFQKLIDEDDYDKHEEINFVNISMIGKIEISKIKSIKETNYPSLNDIIKRIQE